jgi:hypothetical protein
MCEELHRYPYPPFRGALLLRGYHKLLSWYANARNYAATCEKGQVPTQGQSSRIRSNITNGSYVAVFNRCWIRHSESAVVSRARRHEQARVIYFSEKSGASSSPAGLISGVWWRESLSPVLPPRRGGNSAEKIPQCQKLRARARPWWEARVGEVPLEFPGKKNIPRRLTGFARVQNDLFTRPNNLTRFPLCDTPTFRNGVLPFASASTETQVIPFSTTRYTIDSIISRDLGGDLMRTV